MRGSEVSSLAAGAIQAEALQLSGSGNCLDSRTKVISPSVAYSMPFNP